MCFVGSMSVAEGATFSGHSKKLACVEFADVDVGLELGFRAWKEVSSGVWTMTKTWSWSWDLLARAVGRGGARVVLGAVTERLRGLGLGSGLFTAMRADNVVVEGNREKDGDLPEDLEDVDSSRR